jgi:hypothetical protein
MIKAAALKAKLKYIDWDAKAKADLEKVKTLQKLHVEEAKIEAIQSIENTDVNQTDITLPQVDPGPYVANYIQTHGNTAIKSEPQLSSAATVNTSKSSTIDSQPKYTTSTHFYKQDTSLHKASDINSLPSGLNPTASDFVSHFKPLGITKDESAMHVTYTLAKSVDDTDPPVTFTYTSMNPIPHTTSATSNSKVIPSEMRVSNIAKQFHLSNFPL